MATTAKYPAATLALTDLGAEFPDAGAPTELTLNGSITSTATSFVVNEAIPTSYPASGWVKIDSETLHYSSFNAGTKTFTVDVRGAQTAYGSGAAAAHTTGATVGMWVSAQALNQIIADLIAVEGQFVQGAAIASAATTDLSTTTGGYVHVTGTTTITSFGTLPAGRIKSLTFDGALTLTYNATSLILQGATNYTTAAGDVFVFVSEGAGNWRELSRRLATAVLLTSATTDLAADVAMASANTYYDGPTVAIAAGTWLLVGTLTILNNTAGYATIKIWDGTTVYASTEAASGASGTDQSLSVSAIITTTGATTQKLSASFNTASATIKAATTAGGTPAKASHLRAVKIG